MPRTVPACRTALTLVVAAVLLAACGGGSANQNSASTSSSTALSSTSPTIAPAAFCKQAISAFTGLEPAFNGAASDPASLVPILQKAATQVRAIKPPAEIASDWAKLGDGLSQFAAAYASLRTKDRAAASSFAAHNAQLLATLTTAVGHVQAYMAKNCGLAVPSGASTKSAAPPS